MTLVLGNEPRVWHLTQSEPSVRILLKQLQRRKRYAAMNSSIWICCLWAQEQKSQKSYESDIGYQKDEYRNRSLFFEQKPVCKHWTDVVKNSVCWDLARRICCSICNRRSQGSHGSPSCSLAVVPNTLHEFKNRFPFSAKWTTSKTLLFPPQILVSSKPVTSLLEIQWMEGKRNSPLLMIRLLHKSTFAHRMSEYQTHSRAYWSHLIHYLKPPC